MSAKRQLESESDPSDSDTDSDHKNVKRKHDDEEEEDKQPLNPGVDPNEEYFDKKYNNRYTEEDEEFKKCLDRPDVSPPIIWGYYGKRDNNYRNSSFRGRDQRSYGSYGNRYDQRGRGGHSYNSYDNRDNRPSDNRYKPYNRY